MSSSKISAILFDFDGTLADTVNYNFVSWRKTLSKYGISLSLDDYILSEGKKAQEVAFHFLEQEELDLSLVDLVLKERQEVAYLQPAPKLFAGVPDLLKDLHSQGFVLGIVSGGRRSRIEGMLGEHRNLISVFVTGDDNLPSKPSPTPYLEAAKRLGVDPGLCLVIENAPLGIAAATAAGMASIGVADSISPHYVLGANRIVRKVIDIPTAIASL